MKGKNSVWALCLLACGNKDGGGLIKVDGSSTVYPITEAVAEQFKKQGGKTNVTVGISGTGGGFKKFCASEIDVANASRPIKPTEVEACQKAGVEYIELPVAYDGIAIVVHPSNDWATSITTDELKTLWAPEAQDKIKKWNQVRPEWPDKEIHLFGAGVDSGTYDYFTEAIVHKEHSSRGDYTSSEDDNVLVQGISSDPLALGFFGIAYYEENKSRVKAVPVDDKKAENGEGPVAPSAETIKNASYQPLARPIFVYVAKKSLDRPELLSFAKFYLEKAPELVPEVGYVALPESVYKLGLERLDKRTTGSLFEGKGSQVNVSLEKLMEAKK